MTYRADRHHGVTICSENDGVRCGREDHDCDRGHLVAAVFGGGVEFAQLIADLLNGHGEAVQLLRDVHHLRVHGERAPGGNETWAEFDRRCEDFLRRWQLATA